MPKPRDWLCSCPDHSKRLHLYSTLNKGIPMQQRSWVNSKAGAKGDCLHIMNAKLSRGLTLDTFTDVPIDKKTSTGPSKRPRVNFGFRAFKGFS